MHGCGLGFDISVSRRSRDPLRPRPRPRSRLGPIDERLGLGIKGLVLGIGLRQLGLVHIPVLIMEIKTFLNLYRNTA